MKFKNKVILAIIGIFVGNCVSYDLHPDYLEGTSFYHSNNNCKCSDALSRVRVSAKKTGLGNVIKEKELFVSEYFILSFYFGRLLGTYDNGNLEVITKEDIQNIKLEKDEFFQIEVEKISYRSNNIVDLLNDILPGVFFRYQRYKISYLVKIIKVE